MKTDLEGQQVPVNRRLGDSTKQVLCVQVMTGLGAINEEFGLNKRFTYQE